MRASSKPSPAVEGERRGGVFGFYEQMLRKFSTAVHAASLIPLFVFACVCLGTSAAPGVLFFQWALSATQAWGAVTRAPALGVAFALSFYLFGFTLLAVIPTVNFVLRAKPKPSRGPFHSLEAVRWYIHNGLLYLVRYTFLEFVTPSPFNVLFYRAMGMKIGRNTQINTTNISDPALITMGKNVTVGGSATIIAHYGMGGFLVIAPVIIKDGATIGLKATIMGAVEIGEKALVMPHSVVLPKTVIGPREIWGGVPAKRIKNKAPKAPVKLIRVKDAV